VNTHSSLIAELKSKEYRDAYVASQIAIGLPFQARQLRIQKGWTQEELAERAGMSQPRIAEIEKPSKRRFNLETLLRIASAHDVGLEVRFVPLGQIVEHDESFDPDSFHIPTFDEELAAAEERERADADIEER
jgi:transcriptional regulator with XRE-family HTH domain